ncbi:MAG: hypothetical protein U0X41_03760 [Chitinophagales bacterium]
MKSDITNGVLLLIVGFASFFFQYKYQSDDDPAGNKWRAFTVIMSCFIGGFYFLIKAIAELFR